MLLRGIDVSGNDGKNAPRNCDSGELSSLGALAKKLASRLSVKKSTLRHRPAPRATVVPALMQRDLGGRDIIDRIDLFLVVKQIGPVGGLHAREQVQLRFDDMANAMNVQQLVGCTAVHFPERRAHPHAGSEEQAGFRTLLG